MFDKLQSIERRYDEILELLGKPEVQSDQSEYRKHAKTLSEIEPVVERFREYKTLTRDITQTEELAASGDADMREPAQQELKSLIACRPPRRADAFTRPPRRSPCSPRRKRSIFRSTKRTSASIRSARVDLAARASTPRNLPSASPISLPASLCPSRTRSRRSKTGRR